MPSPLFIPTAPNPNGDPVLTMSEMTPSRASSKGLNAGLLPAIMPITGA